MERTIGFNREPVSESSTYDMYKGKYVTVVPMSGGSVSGKVCDIRDGHIVLNPFQSQDWDSNEGAVRGLRDEEAMVECSKINFIGPTTRKNILNYCKYNNKINGNGNDIDKDSSQDKDSKK